MTRCKKLLSVLLCVVMVLGMIPGVAMGAEHTSTITANAAWGNGDTVGVPGTDMSITGSTDPDNPTVITISGTVTLKTRVDIKNNVVIKGLGSDATLLFDWSTATVDSTTGYRATLAPANSSNVTIQNLKIKCANNQKFSYSAVTMGSNCKTILDTITFDGFSNGVTTNNKGDNIPVESIVNAVWGNLTLKNNVTFTNCGSINPIGIHAKNSILPMHLDNFTTNSNTIDIRYATAQETTDPFLFADGAEKAHKNIFKFKSGNATDGYTYVNTYYAGGNLYVGTKEPSGDLITHYEIDLGNKPTISNATVGGGDFHQILAKGNQMEAITFTPTTGKTFKGADISALTNALQGTGLSASVDSNGVLTISGKPSKDVDLSSFSGWPTPVADSKTVKLPKLGSSGLKLVSGDLEQTVSGTGAITPIVLTADDSHILSGDDIQGLNHGILSETGLSASYDPENGTLTISGTPSKSFDLSGSQFPYLTSAEAVITDSNGNVLNKYASLSGAIGNANSGTVEMKKNPATAVENATLKGGVTLKDTSGNTYKAVGDATVDVATNGKVKLESGKMEVKPASGMRGSVEVIPTGTGAGGTVTGEAGKSFTVSTQPSPTVTIPNKGESVSTNLGYSFTAGNAGSTFPLWQTKIDLSKNGKDDAVTVAKSMRRTVIVGKNSKDETVEVAITGEGVAVNSGDVTVTKGDGEETLATVTVAKKGDKFTVGGKTYVAGADDTEFTIDKDGNVKLTRGGIALSDGESFTGIVSEVEIENPADSGSDSVTVVAKKDYDEVTVPAGGSGTVKIGDKTYANKSTSEDLVLKVTKEGVELVRGELTETLADGQQTTGLVSGANIANPSGSGNDTVTVKSDVRANKDTVTVSAGTDKSVTITKKGETTGTTYVNGDPSNELVIDVTAEGAELESGGVMLEKDQSIILNGVKVENKDNSPLLVTKDGPFGDIRPGDGKSFSVTEFDGQEEVKTTFTGKSSDAKFSISSYGGVALQKGSAKVTPEANKTGKITVSPYNVTGENAFEVTAGSDNTTATVTIPTKGESVSNGKGLVFTAGAANSTFPLDGSKLNNSGDSVTVSKDEETVINIQEANSEVEPTLPAINVTIPGTNTGDTTVTKGNPTVVRIGDDNDTFSVNGTTYPTAPATAKAGEEYVIDMATGVVSKIQAKILDRNGDMLKHGSLSDMLNQVENGQTIQMVSTPETAVEDGTLKNGVTLKDMAGNAYKANGGDATVDVATDGQVSLKTGKLDVTPAEGKEPSVKVAKNNNGEFYTVSGQGKFSVTAAKGNGDGSDADNAKATVTIQEAGKSVSNGEGLTFTAGTANSTFPLDGSKLNNNGDSVGVAQGNELTVNLTDDVNVEVSTTRGPATVTKGQPADFVGKVDLTAENSFIIGGKQFTTSADSTFGIKADKSVTLLDGKGQVSKDEELSVKAEGWTKEVKVSNNNESGTKITVQAEKMVDGKPSLATAEVKEGETVTIGGKTYQTVESDSDLEGKNLLKFDQDGNVTLNLGKVELAKGQSINGGVGNLPIQNASADDATKITVETTKTAPAKDIVTVPGDGKVKIGNVEYTNPSDSDSMTLEIDADGKVSLADGQVELDKGEMVKLNGAAITNNGNDAMIVGKNGTTGTLTATANGSFTVGGTTVEKPSQNMDYTVEADGTLKATLAEGESVTINGVTYTSGSDSTSFEIDPTTGEITITGTYNVAGADGSNTFVISGKVTQSDGSTAVSGATIRLTQGGANDVQIATVKTAADGTYTISGVPNGTYNLIVYDSTSGKTMTKLVTVDGSDLNNQNLSLPGDATSSVVEINDTASALNGAMVGGLDDEADSISAGGNTVEIKLTVVTKDDTDTGIKDHEDAQGKTLLPLELNLAKKVNGAVDSSYNTTSQVLEIIISFQTSGKKDFVVFRKHEGTVETFSQLNDRPAAPYTDMTFYVGDGFIVLYTQKFSDYAIGYDLTGGSSSGSNRNNGVSLGKTDHGSLTLSPKAPKTGETVTITVKPEEGYKLGSLKVTDDQGNELTLTKISETEYTFVKPSGKVKVAAEFVKDGGAFDQCAKDETCPISAFADAQAKEWYHDGVHFCLDQGLMKGYDTGDFGPLDEITRSQVAMILYRMSGSPELSSHSDFADVEEGAWYHDAILWAAEQGIVKGYNDGSTFGPEDPITREQMAVMLYRYAQLKGRGFQDAWAYRLNFSDLTELSDWAVEGVSWCNMEQILTGKNDQRLDPQGETTRAEAATMMMRLLTQILK